MDFLYRWNPLSSAEVVAFEGCHSVGKLQNFYHLPVLEEAIDKSRVKDIAGTGRIDCLYLKSFHIEDLAVDESHGTFISQSGTKKPGGMLLKFKDGLFSI